MVDQALPALSSRPRRVLPELHELRVHFGERGFCPLLLATKLQIGTRSLGGESGLGRSEQSEEYDARQHRGRRQTRGRGQGRFATAPAPQPLPRADPGARIGSSSRNSRKSSASAVAEA